MRRGRSDRPSRNRRLVERAKCLKPYSERFFRKPSGRVQEAGTMCRHRALGVHLPTAGGPAMKQKSSNPQAIDSGVERRHGELRILLVEDNDLIQELATAVLDLEGYQADVADNGRRAV